MSPKIDCPHCGEIMDALEYTNGPDGTGDYQLECDNHLCSHYDKNGYAYTQDFDREDGEDCRADYQLERILDE